MSLTDARSSPLTFAVHRIDARLREIRALHEVHVAFERDQRVALGREAAHQHELAGFMEQRHETRQHALDMRMLGRLLQDAAVERHDIGPQMPHAIDIRMLHAEAVQRDQKARLAQRIDDFGKSRRLAARLLGNFEHDALRRQADILQRCEQGIAVARVHQRSGMQTQEKPFVVAVEGVEVAQMQRFREPAEFEQIAATRRLCEHLVRRNVTMRVVAGAQGRVIADRAPVRHGKHGLEHAEDGVLAVQHGATRSIVAGDGPRRLEAGRVEINHAHGVWAQGG
jgi:hypothetical protein